METITIIGAGASGLACMNTLAKYKKYNIIVLEQSSKSARKILASGNGRCNVSHKNIDIKAYNCQNETIKKIIEQFNVYHFFDQLSLKLRDMGDLIYPYSLSSQSVKNALLKEKNISLIEECKVIDIKKKDNYKIITNQGVFESDKVIIATGSPASHLSGTENLNMLKSLKIHINPFTPSLVPLKTKPVFKKMKGQRVKGDALLYDGKQFIEKQSGEIMFTDYGLSGICIMQLSRHLHLLQDPYIVLNLLPDLTQEELEKYDEDGLFHEKVAAVIKNNNLDPQKIKMKITGNMGIEKAQVCHGGVDLKEVDENLMLKKYPGIYVLGEALDVDGDCGGYNLHFAFGSGEYAGRKIGENNA